MTTTAAPLNEAASSLLPEGLVGRLEQAAGARITKIKPRGGGGAARRGAEITLAAPNGETILAYLAYRPTGASAETGTGISSLLAFRRESSLLTALSGPLKSSGVRAPELLAVDRTNRAILSRFVAGEANFNLLATDAERRSVGEDFMAQLAALHAIDFEPLQLDGFTPAEPPSKIVKARIQELRNNVLASHRDPLILLSLDWLERHIPADPERLALLHGDCGPANFLYADGKVTALLDWELAHYGDPAADLGMVCIRNLFQPFIPLKDAFASYEAAGGARVDLQRVRFYRALFQTSFASPPEALMAGNGAGPPVLGASLMYSHMHMRVLTEALADAMGITLEPVALPEAPVGAHARAYEIALLDLRDYIVPRVTDQEASAKAKGLVRLVKWWRDIERWGAPFAEAERRELSQALGKDLATVDEGRRALSERILAHDIDAAVALRLYHARTTRDTALYADAMGALAQTHFKPLD